MPLFVPKRHPATLPRALLAGLVVLFSGLPARAGDQNIAETVRSTVARTIEIRQRAQKEQDGWHEEQGRLAAELEALETTRSDLARERDGLKRRVEAAELRIQEKERQLTELSRIAREIEPLLRKAVEDLRGVVAEDLPFLLEERKNRLDGLDKRMDDPQVPLSEKFRRVLEACLVEAEYGQTVNVYTQTLELDGDTVMAQVLRLGRLSLFCRTMDRETAGFFDPVAARWRRLPDRTLKEIGKAMEIGSRRRAADLVVLPVGRLGAP